MTKAPIHERVEPGFEPVADSFVRGFEKGELGAAVSAYVDGRKVVDLRGGWAGAQRTLVLLVADRDVRVITEDGEFLAEFTIDPAKP